MFRARGHRRPRRIVDHSTPGHAVDTAWRAPQESPPLNEAEKTFLRYVFDSAGLNIEAYRTETLQRRLAACLRALRVTNVIHAERLLMKHPGKLAAAVDALVIGVTSFFRDAEVFDQLARVILPALPLRPRIWSVGCSEGQEIYSVAMLLADRGELDRATLLATDCRRAAVSSVREGIYDDKDIESVSPQWRERYFDPDPPNWQIARPLRQVVESRVADVTVCGEPGIWDLILCRNMAIYLRNAVAMRLWAQLTQALRPGGFLVLGKAERPMGCAKLAPVGPCIYRRCR